MPHVFLFSNLDLMQRATQSLMYTGDNPLIMQAIVMRAANDLLWDRLNEGNTFDTVLTAASWRRSRTPSAPVDSSTRVTLTPQIIHTYLTWVMATRLADALQDVYDRLDRTV